MVIDIKHPKGLEGLVAKCSAVAGLFNSQVVSTDCPYLSIVESEGSSVQVICGFSGFHKCIFDTTLETPTRL